MNVHAIHQDSAVVRTRGWLLAASAFAIALIVLLVAYWGTAQSLVWVWDHDGTYQYAFLIPPLSLWTAFNLRAQVRPGWSSSGMPVICSMSICCSI